MDASKIDTILNWPQPKTRKALQRFLGFSNFYRKFIKNFSSVVKPLTRLTSIKERFLWNDVAETAFSTLKMMFTTAPILRLPNPDFQYILEVDASNSAIGAILSQRESLLHPLHPVAFHSRAFTPAELNYPVGEKELLAIKDALEHWRHLLEGTAMPILIYTDHQNLQYLKRNKTLSSRQVRWALFFDRFNFLLTYRPGSRNGKADSLSRLHETEEVSTPQVGLIPEHKILASLSDWRSDLLSALAQDAAALPPGLTSDPQGFYYKGEKLYVPPSYQLRIMKLLHDAPLAGHPGISRSKELVSRYFWWPNMSDYITKYIQSCDTCASSKPCNQKAIRTPNQPTHTR